MYTRYYDGYSSQMQNPVPAAPEPKVPEEEIAESQIAVSEAEQPVETKSFLPTKGLGGFKSDDILLIALIFLIATESADDFIMPLILGALLLE